MHHFFADQTQISENEIHITGSDVNHIRNVLRIRPGEHISVSGGDTEYRCEITDIREDCVTAKILWKQDDDTELPCRISLFQALPKGDKMDMILQKAVELGAFEIIPMTTKRTVVRLDEKRRQTRQKRWNEISKNAAEQSKRTFIPEVRPLISFAEAVSCAASFTQKFIPYERAEDIDGTKTAFAAIQPGDTIAVFIGPEGGFDEEEIALAGSAGIRPITLGRRILRTETAGMTVLSILMFQLEQ